MVIKEVEADELPKSSIIRKEGQRSRAENDQGRKSQGRTTRNSLSEWNREESN